jgi:hypothetical protein
MTGIVRYVPIFFGGMLIIESPILLKGARWYHRLAVAALGILILYLGIHRPMHDSKLADSAGLARFSANEADDSVCTAGLGATPFSRRN